MGSSSSKEVYLNARANLDAKGKKNMNMNDLKEARRETERGKVSKKSKLKNTKFYGYTNTKKY
jgi:hypothetical protein